MSIDEKSKERNFYKLIGKIALEFRLSLNNLCRLTGKESTEENRLNFYEKIKEYLIGKNNILDYQYRYLFFNETVNEPSSISVNSYKMALDYWKRYKKAKESKNKEEFVNVINELNKTEIEFQNLIKSDVNRILTEEEIIIISKYRIKKVLSKKIFCEEYRLIHRTNLSKREKMLESDDLKYKINNLNEFCYDITQNRGSRTRS